MPEATRFGERRMISLSQVERLRATGQWAQLVRRLMRNGRASSGRAVDHLTRVDGVRPAALGLALQRVVELTYGPTAQAAALAEDLLALQDEGGLFRSFEPGVASNATPWAATAVALRGLLDHGRQLKEAKEPIPARLHRAVRRGLAALAQGQGAGGLIGDDVTVSAVALWQLGDHEAFRARVDHRRLLEIVSILEAGPAADDLLRLARAAAA